jgi:hypothetical protein
MRQRISTKLRDIRNGKKELDRVLPEWNFYVGQFQKRKHGSISYEALDKIIGTFKVWQIIGERESTLIIKSFSNGVGEKNSIETISEKINDRVLDKIGELETRKKETEYEMFKNIRQQFLSHVYILFIPTMFIFLNALFSKTIDSQNCLIVSKVILYILAGVAILAVCIHESSMWLKVKPKIVSSLFTIICAGLSVMFLLIWADACPIDSSVTQLIKAPKWALVKPHFYGHVISYASIFFAWSMFILGWLHLQFLIKVKRDNEVSGVVGGIHSV